MYHKDMNSTLKVDKDFLMKITKQVDKLTAEVKELKTPKNSVFNTEETFETAENVAEQQKQFLAELGQLITKYKILQLTVSYKK